MLDIYLLDAYQFLYDFRVEPYLGVVINSKQTICGVLTDEIYILKFSWA